MKFDPVGSIKRLYEESRHVLSISYKPNTAQFIKTLKIVLLGTIIVGALGYIISIIIGLIV